MGRGSVSSKFLVILNTLYTLFGVGIIGLSAWFYIQIKSLTNLRNPNHYAKRLDFEWPELLPWMYGLVGTFIVLLSCCAFLGVVKKSRAVMMTHLACQVLSVIALLAVATITVTRADSEASDKFIADTIEDAFHHMSDERGDDVKKGFADLEMRLECCGYNTSLSYKHYSTSYGANLPLSCCNTLYSGHKVDVCPANDMLANSRPGCTDMVNFYVRIFLKIFTGAAILTAFVGALNLAAAACLTNSLMVKKKVTQDGAQRKSNMVCAANEFEVEKVPLKV